MRLSAIKPKLQMFGLVELLTSCRGWRDIGTSVHENQCRSSFDGMGRCEREKYEMKINKVEAEVRGKHMDTRVRRKVVEVGGVLEER